jgi:hypothetical protein
MFRLFVTLAALLAATICRGQQEVVLYDAFKPDLQRTWSLSQPETADDWRIEQKINFTHEKLFFRFSSGSARLQQLRLLNREGQEVWSAATFTKSALTPKLPPDEYTLECLGRAGAEKFSMVVNTHEGRYLLPSWNVSDAQATSVPERGVRLQPLNEGKPGRIFGRIFRITPGQFHTFVIELESEVVQEFLLRYTQQKGSERIRETARLRAVPGQLQRWTVPVTAVAASLDLTIEFTHACRLQSLTVQKSPPPERQKTVADKVFTFEPRAPEPDPANLSLAVPVAYRRPPRHIYPGSIPQDFELISEGSTFTTPGDYAVWYFAIHNPEQERQLQLLSISALRNGNNELPADSIAISNVHFWDYPRGPYTYYEIPELIYPQEEIILPPDGNRIFWLQTRLAEDCPPGMYSGKLEVRCGEETIALPVRLRVLPFRLKTPPDMVWSVMSSLHVNPQKRYSDELTVRYMRDILDYGVTSISYSLSAEATVEKFQRRRKAAGMNGPVVCRIYEGAIAARRCGKKLVERWFDDPEIRQAAVAYIREVDGWMKKYGGPGYDDWYYMGTDEPHNGRMELVAWQNRLAKEAGVKTASNVYGPRYVNELAPDLDISCNSFIGQNQKVYQELQELSGKYPSLRYWYLGGGCYGGQEGGLMPNRLESGFQSYKLGVSGHVSYTYQAHKRGGPNSDPMDNFGTGKSYGMTYPVAKPTPEKVTIFSLEWEGIREGITDYKYLYTLEQMLKEAEQAGRAEAATAARQTLTEILGYIPWREDRASGNGITETQYFNNDTAEKLRAMAATAILTLQEAQQ